MEKKHPIPRVKCIVDSCSYWHSGNVCAASTIEIRPPDASTVQETDCVTFELKNNNP